MSADPGATPSVRTREAYELGVTRGELAGPRWTAPFRGVRRPEGAAPVGAPPDPMQRLYDVAELLPDGAAIGGWGAAYLLGARELDGRGPSGTEQEPVPVVLPPPLLIRARDGIVRWRSKLTANDVVVVDGIPCTGPVRAGFDLARTLPLRRGVVALDVLGRTIDLSPGNVSAYRDRHRRWRGVPRVDAAVPLADPRSRSPGETRLRLVWVLDAGLPTPEVNPEIRDTGGFLLGEADLLEPESGLLAEYDGADHREIDRHVTDNAREEWLEDTGLVVVRAAAPDLWRVNRRRTVDRLLTGYRRARRRDRSADRWTWAPRPRIE